MRSLSKIKEQGTSELSEFPLSAQFVWQAAVLCECCPRAAVGFYAAHIPLHRDRPPLCFLGPLLATGLSTQ